MIEETIVGSVTLEHELMPSAMRMVVSGNGKVALHLAGKVTHHPGDFLLPALYELIRKTYPGATLPDVGDGPEALSHRVANLTRLLDNALSELQAHVAENAEISQKLAEAEAANAGLEAELSRVR